MRAHGPPTTKIWKPSRFADMANQVCRRCGKEYEGSHGSPLCPECVNAQGNKSNPKVRSCKTCGAEFPGGSRAYYCPSCRTARKNQQALDAQRRRRAGQSCKVPRTRNKKICVICGASFEAPPSDKTVTCSPACRSARAKDSLKKRREEDPTIWGHSSKAYAARSSNPEWREAVKGYAQNASDAAMLLPEGQRGPQNRTAKNWILIDPDGAHIEVTNLLDWAREYYDFFEPDADDIDAAARRIASGFRAIAGSIRGVPSRKRPVSSYKGWGLYALPTSKED